LREQLCLIDPEVQAATALAHEFISLVETRQSELLEPWLRQVMQSTISELRTFAAGVQRDYDAVRAALEHPWSNGQVEGQVNRLKLVKRQMYGRANFDLLRVRVLATA
jgi:transposase